MNDPLGSCLIFTQLQSEFNERVRKAKKVIIINTFIPYLDRMRDALLDALEHNETELEIYLLDPNSKIADERDKALSIPGKPQQKICRPRIRDNLDFLANLVAGSSNHHLRDKVTVIVYDSIPSVSVYCADNFYSLGPFAHGKLAVESPQFVTMCDEPIIREYVEHEVRELEQRGMRISDLNNWKQEIKFND